MLKLNTPVFISQRAPEVEEWAKNIEEMRIYKAKNVASCEAKKEKKSLG